MANKYTIKLNNKSGNDNSYSFFVTDFNHVSHGQFAQNWITQFIPDGGWWDFTITDQFYAWTGTSSTSADGSIVTQTGSGKPVHLQEVDQPGSHYVMTVKHGVPEFGHDLKDNTSQPGTFKISTDKSFAGADKFLIGLAYLDGSGQIVPLNASTALPNSIHLFRVSLDFTLKQVVEAGQEGPVPPSVTISFNQTGISNAIITAGESGVFTVTYS